MTAIVKGLELNYKITGQGQDILFLHGWGSSLEAFDRMIAPLSRKFRCVSVDLPGFGKSSLPKEALNLDEYSNFVLDLIKHLNLKNPIFVGHSNGGRIILHLASKGLIKPEKIILFGAAGIVKKKTFKQKLRLYSFKTAKWFLSIPLWKKQSAGLLESVRAYFGSADYNSASPVMRQTMVNLINVDLTSKLKDVNASTLLIWGDQDTETPLFMAKIMEKEIKDCGLCVIKGGTHWCFVEYPAFVDSILENFLGGLND